MPTHSAPLRSTALIFVVYITFLFIFCFSASDAPYFLMKSHSKSRIRVTQKNIYLFRDDCFR